MLFILALAAATPIAAVGRDPGPEPTLEQIKTEVEERTLDQLIDPDSAKFKYPYAAIKFVTKRGVDGWAACGLVNSKNRMGGYAGYMIAFIRFDQGRVTYFNLVEDEGGQREFLCGKMPAREQVAAE